MPPVVEARLSCVTYEGLASPVLSGCHLEVGAGEFVLLTGASGSGKTTLARALAGSLPPTAKVDGTIRRNPKDRVGVIFQEPVASLSPFRRVGKQIADVLTGHGETNPGIRVQALLETTGLAGRGGAYPHELSSGECQRIAIARALAVGPALLIADEPASSLDAETGARIAGLVHSLHLREGFAVLWITHRPGDVYGYATRALRMEDGRLHPDTLPPPPLREPRVLGRPGELLLSARGIGKRNGAFQLDGIDIDLYRGRTLALCGPSGSGKSTLARCLAKLERTDSGEIRLNEPRQFHRAVQLVMPDPSQALNPRMSVAEAIGEPLEVLWPETRQLHPLRIAELMRQVRLPLDSGTRKVVELSGGQRRRVLIARALAVSPSVLILDEATNGLDAGVSEEILNLLLELQQKSGLAFLWITHDGATLPGFADSVAYMQGGRLRPGVLREVRK
ncbi:MAG: ATP-binding cassette domain-containing protein [Bryobacteraceae bacterium]|nr:ATP-binding cassette domain-containing protein [Bryobacteraceae bacterium]